MNELPDGWQLVRLSDVGSFESGGTPSKEQSKYWNGNIPFVTGADITDLYITSKNARSFLTDEGLKSGKTAICHPGTVLFVTRTRVGRVGIASQVMGASQDLSPFACGEALFAEYLCLYLKSIADYLLANCRGSTILGLTRAFVKNIQLPLPPLAEQKRIVAKLDRLFARSQSAREELARIPKLIDRYKQAILESAFEGKLTADWRKDNTDIETAQDLLLRLQKHCGHQKKLIDERTKNNIGERASLPTSWCWVQVEAITEVFLGRQRSPKNHTGPNMRSYVRAANITWNGWDLSDVKEMNFDDQDFKKYKLKAGDVLLNEGSGSADEVGKPAVWQGDIEDCCFQNTLICVRPFEAMSEYLYFVFLHAARSKAFVEETRGVNIHHIGKERLAKFWIALPPIAEQQEIVSRIKFKFESIEEGFNQVNKARILLERLDQETLSKAFRGNLVDQDPNDEPASALLDRIRAEQQTQLTTRKVRKSKT